MPRSCTLRGLGSRDHLRPDLWREVLRSLNVAHFAALFRLPVRVRLAQTPGLLASSELPGFFGQENPEIFDSYELLKSMTNCLFLLLLCH